MSEPDAFSHKPDRKMPGPPCTLGTVLATLDPDGPLRRLPEVLDPSSGWRASQIARVLKDNGHAIQAITVARHRRRHTGEGCACP